MVKRLVRQLTPLGDDVCKVLAVSLLSAQPYLEWEHPLGRPMEDWSYESGTVAMVNKLVATERYAIRGRTTVVDKTLESAQPDDLRTLVAALMTYHLRAAGKIGTVSRETEAELAA